MSKQRQIKFRVWTGSEFFDYSFVGLMEDYGIDSLEELFNHKELICQQFTGLQDIKGKDIYEGDIVKISELSSNQNAGPGKRQILQTFEKAIVTWDNNMLAYMYNPIRKVGANIPHQLLRYGYEPQIIGNIFENPELLEK